MSETLLTVPDLAKESECAVTCAVGYKSDNSNVYDKSLYTGTSLKDVFNNYTDYINQDPLAY